MHGLIRLLLILSFIPVSISTIAQPMLLGTTLGGTSTVNGSTVTTYGSIFTLVAGENSIKQSYLFGGGLSGDSPEASLLIASNGKLYGTTVQGGQTEDGILYEFDFAANQTTKLADFNNFETGRSPYGALVEAANGKFYGVTWAGGSLDKGVLFEFDPTNNSLIKKVDFVGENGDNPWSQLINYKGKLYGMTLMGGTNNKGVLFEYDPVNGIYTKKINFGDLSYAASPWTKLTVSNDGKIYGTIYGTTSYIIFEYDPINNLIIERASFADLNVGNTRPVGSLVQVPNRKMYGVSDMGGASDIGFLFEFDPATNSIVNKYNFKFNSVDGSDGYIPRGSLFLSSVGKLYGTTKSGGLGGTFGGVLFEYDYISNVYTKKIDFGKGNGNIPDNLIELCLPPIDKGVIESSKQSLCEGVTDFLVSTSTIPAAGSYLWALPEGAIIKSGVNTSSLSLDFSKVVAGNYVISVTGKNACGTGPSTSISLTINEKPAKPTIALNNTNPEMPVLTASEGFRYQWLKNGLEIKDATSKTYTAVSEGDYSVVVINLNECSSTPSNSIAISITGLSEPNENPDTILYPNPTEEWLTVEGVQIDKTQPSIVIIRDLSGRKLIAEKGQNLGTKFNVQHLSPGQYTIQIIQKETSKTWRFIKN